MKVFLLGNYASDLRQQLQYIHSFTGSSKRSLTYHGHFQICYAEDWFSKTWPDHFRWEIHLYAGSVYSSLILLLHYFIGIEYIILKTWEFLFKVQQKYIMLLVVNIKLKIIEECFCKHSTSILNYIILNAQIWTCLWQDNGEVQWVLAWVRISMSAMISDLL